MYRLGSSGQEEFLVSAHIAAGVATGGCDPHAALLRASEGLSRSAPEFSAGTPVWLWQKALLGSICLLLFAGAVAAPREMMALLFALLAIPFFFVVILRAVALQTIWNLPDALPVDTGTGPIKDDDLPQYSILVPLFREAEVLGDLLASLSRIDYPKSKLEILLIVESIDLVTRNAIASRVLEPNFKVVTVPDGAPRTKPRALNYALEFSRGDYVVVYDAEDCPDPQQIRGALALLRSNAGKIGCVQAQLNIYNPHDSWLTRQFAIEYTALFDCLLPALERLKLPVPLGGTSNHFPRRVLEKAGGWDPYNVTEDADLGIRMSRAGLEVRVLSSTTWEEAPSSFGMWLKQRTRWLKGWMQTYLVHMREPRRLLRELGLAKFLGLQVLMGGLVLSALVHPWFYLLTAVDWASGTGQAMGSAMISHVLWWLGLINMVLGYLTGMALGIAAALRRGWLSLAANAVLMPIYWILISAAAYRAAWQLLTAPYLWEKTDHKARSENAGVNPRCPTARAPDRDKAA